MPKKKARKDSGVQSLLVELLTEELPPKALQQLSRSFSDGVERSLRNRGLLNRDSKTTRFATPRRLAVWISRVSSKGKDKTVPRKFMPLSVARGPDGTQSEPLKKKLDSMGYGHLATGSLAVTNGPDSLYVESDGKSEYVYLTTLAPGQTLEFAAQRTLQDVIDELPAPKVMSYPIANEQDQIQFARPVRGLLALHGKKVVDVSILGLKSTRFTRGHRFAGRSKVEIPAADQYETALEKQGSVIASFEKRKERIRAELEKKAAGAEVVFDDAFLDEVTALVEWPAVYSGNFDNSFLELPQECLELSMKQHQRYFPLTDKTGKLLPRFLTVSNLQTSDPREIIHGNERVLQARLSDAKFFFDQDRKMRLEERVPRLAQVVYHNKLGSQLERVERLQLLAGKIARDIGADPPRAERAAWLSKADLLTNMVGEFPELQGIMGRYYAVSDGEVPDVAEAIGDQYRLRGDDLDPANLVSASLYLADRIDQMIGLFGIGEQPTGEKDPFGLRRAALGITSTFELIIAKQQITGEEIPDVRDFLAYAATLFSKGLLAASVVDQVHDFILERYWNYLAAGLPKDVVEAVISQRPNLVEVNARVQAVQTFRRLPEAKSLSAANKRIRNILRKSAPANGELDESLLKDPAEIALYESVRNIEPEIESNMLKRDYTRALRMLADIRGVVDEFFDNVLVNTEDAQLRVNRLALLHRLNSLMNRVADISKLVIEK